jgi:hypothetical protein
MSHSDTQVLNVVKVLATTARRLEERLGDDASPARIASALTEVEETVRVLAGVWRRAALDRQEPDRLPSSPWGHGMASFAPTDPPVFLSRSSLPGFGELEIHQDHETGSDRD